MLKAWGHAQEASKAAEPVSPSLHYKDCHLQAAESVVGPLRRESSASGIQCALHMKAVLES